MAFALIALIGIGILLVLGAIVYGAFWLIRFCYRAWRDALGFSPKERFIRQFKRDYIEVRKPFGEHPLEDDALHDIAELAWKDCCECRNELLYDNDGRASRRNIARIEIHTDHPDFLTMTWIRCYILTHNILHPTAIYHINRWFNFVLDEKLDAYNARDFETTGYFIEHYKQINPGHDMDPLPGNLPVVPDLPDFSQIQLGFG